MTLTCGLIAKMYGPVEGRRHDAYMLTDCQTVWTMDVIMTLTCGLIAKMYGPVEGRRHDANMWTDC